MNLKILTFSYRAENCQQENPKKLIIDRKIRLILSVQNRDGDGDAVKSSGVRYLKTDVYSISNLIFNILKFLISKFKVLFKSYVSTILLSILVGNYGSYELNK